MPRRGIFINNKRTTTPSAYTSTLCAYEGDFLHELQIIAGDFFYATGFKGNR